MKPRRSRPNCAPKLGEKNVNGLTRTISPFQLSRIPRFLPRHKRKLVLTDATFEKLHEILGENPGGVLVVRDELTGWLAQLDKQGREGERGFFLQAWNGDGGFTIDRIGRGSIHVPAVCVSLLGNIQPGRLRGYLSEVLEGGPTDDGLFQRFQLLVWPDPPRNWRLVDRLPNRTAAVAAENVYARLANLSVIHLFKCVLISMPSNFSMNGGPRLKTRSVIILACHRRSSLTLRSTGASCLASRDCLSWLIWLRQKTWVRRH